MYGLSRDTLLLLRPVRPGDVGEGSDTEGKWTKGLRIDVF